MRPELDIFTESPVRTFTDWTPGLVRSAQVTADGGSLRLAADLCEALFGDGRVQGVLGTRVKGLLGLPLTFDGDGDRRRRSAVERALEEDFPAVFPEDEASRILSWGVLFGVGLGELVWQKRGRRVVPRLRFWHPRWLRFDWASREWRLAIDGGTEIKIAPGDGKWFLFTPYGANRPWSDAPWRAVSVAWLVKKFAVEDWAQYSEVHGRPVRVGTAPQGADKDTRKEIAAALASLGRNASVALPPGYDLKFAEASADTWQTFKEEIAWANTEMAIALVGQNLTSEVKEGSRAAATVHDGVRHDLIEFDAQALATALHEQVVSWWAEFNFGSRVVAPWPQWDTSPPEDKKAKADTLVSLAQAVSALQTAQAPIDVRAVLEDAGVPLLPEGAAPKVPAGGEVAPAEEGTEALRAGRAALDAREPIDEAQDYVDRIGDAARDAATKALAPDLEAVLQAIDGAESFQSLQAQLPELFAAMKPDGLADLLALSGVLSDLVGRRAVRQET